jgi:hypothetical protein
MLEYNTFRAGIRVDGDFLNVYDVEISPEENKVTCWIASEAGKVSPHPHIMNVER